MIFIPQVGDFRAMRRNSHDRSFCASPSSCSAKPSMSGHPRNVRQSRADGANPDRMIVGRENGLARHACPCATRRRYHMLHEKGPLSPRPLCTARSAVFTTHQQPAMRLRPDRVARSDPSNEGFADKGRLVAWIRQESSRIRHLWRLRDSEVLSLFSGLAYPCNMVAERRSIWGIRVDTGQCPYRLASGC